MHKIWKWVGYGSIVVAVLGSFAVYVVFPLGAGGFTILGVAGSYLAFATKGR